MFVALFTDRRIRFEAKCDLTTVSVQYVDIVNKMLVDHEEEQWVEIPPELQCKTKQPRRAVQSSSVPELHMMDIYIKCLVFQIA